MPATSILLQNRLGFSKETIAFDINIGCSGFLYGLSIVYSIIQNLDNKKAFLLNGETSEFADKYKTGLNSDYTNLKLNKILEKVVLVKDFINSSKVNCKHIANTILNKKLYIIQ